MVVRHALALPPGEQRLLKSVGKVLADTFWSEQPIPENAVGADASIAREEENTLREISVKMRRPVPTEGQVAKVEGQRGSSAAGRRNSAHGERHTKEAEPSRKGWGVEYQACDAAGVVSSSQLQLIFFPHISEE